MTDITPERLARFEAHLKGWEECFLGEDGRWYVGTAGVMQVALTLSPADLWEWPQLLCEHYQEDLATWVIMGGDNDWEVELEEERYLGSGNYEKKSFLYGRGNDVPSAFRAAVIAAVEQFEEQERE